MEESVTQTSDGVCLNESLKRDDTLSLTSEFDDSYDSSIEKARQYAVELIELSASDKYLEEISSWLTDYVKSSGDSSLFNNSFKVTGNTFDYSSWSFLNKLYVSHQLKRYLHDSFSYMLMRDIGLNPDTDETQNICRQFTVPIYRSIQKRINNSSNRKTATDIDDIIPHDLRNDPEIENEIFRLKNKISRLQQLLPVQLDKTNGLRKLVKIIAGLILHEQIQQIKQPLSFSEYKLKICSALRLGYSYGITYPLIDDILDNRNFLNADERLLFNRSIQTTLLNQSVVSFPKFSSTNKSFMSFVYQELSDAFITIKKELGKVKSQLFFKSAYVFFRAQAAEHGKQINSISDKIDTVSLLTPMIVKSAGSRIVANQLTSQSNTEKDYFFYFGIYNQFNDDIKDIDVDHHDDNVTPYSLPSFEKNTSVKAARLHWAIVYYLFTKVYNNNVRVKAMLIQRTLNAFQSVKCGMTSAEFEKRFHSHLSTGHQQFDKSLYSAISSDNYIAWFDKFISAQLATKLEAQQEESNDFQSQYQSYKSFINDHLKLEFASNQNDTSLIEFQNYAVLNGGKRIRSVLAHHLMTHHWKNDRNATIPVNRLLEYMHVASIIIDDLPSQDNADYRRGSPALHKYAKSVAAAELTAISLIMKAVEEQALISQFPAERVLKSLQYATQTTQMITQGQLLDLGSTRNSSEKALSQLTWLKTGKGIEACFVIPAILNNASDEEVRLLEQLAYHIGMTFQIKDDLLDHSSNQAQLGKPVRQDINKASFVTVLGNEATWQKLNQHYGDAKAIIEQFDPTDLFLKKLLDYIAFRNV
ncbi:MAG: polyprenyl synthetase family protein [Gammaproteobacteria bacterium]|nr:polyprenyl synthetase family protein [Gammaproteobacteria bacterium]